jgi:hypothetical protein
MGSKRPLGVPQTLGNGCAFFNYNNDSKLDILLVGQPLALYQGNGQESFQDVTGKAGLQSISGRFVGCAVGDYDGDGWNDIYLSAYRGGKLLRNDGARLFQDVTTPVGLAAQPWGTSCAFADVDGDDRLDLYIGNYVVFDSHTEPQMCSMSGNMTACGLRYYQPERGVLYRDEGAPLLLHNRVPKDSDRNWIGFQLKGIGNNRNAYGATVSVQTGDLKLLHNVSRAVLICRVRMRVFISVC